MHAEHPVRLVCLGLCALLLILLLPACDLDTSEILPDCDPATLVAATSLYPADGTVVSDLTPRLSWSYPEYCNPPGFLVLIDSPSVEATVEHQAFSLDGVRRSMESQPLQPGRMYSWQVRVNLAYEYSEMATFFTGPACTEGDRLMYQPVDLMNPPDGDVVGLSTPILAVDGSVRGEKPKLHFTWDDAMPCLPPEGYTIEVSRDPTFRREELLVQRTFTGNNTQAWASFMDGRWQECSVHYWRVLTGTVDPLFSDPYDGIVATSEVRSFTINIGDILCLPDLLTPVVPRDPIGLPPTALVEGSAKCRSGPGLDYQVLSYLEAGAHVSIAGRNGDSSWWYLLDPGQQIDCWIAAQAIRVDGDTEAVPLIEVGPPVLPEITVTPTTVPAFDCAVYNTDPVSCDTVAGNTCRWDATVPPNGACVNR